MQDLTTGHIERFIQLAGVAVGFETLRALVDEAQFGDEDFVGIPAAVSATDLMVDIGSAPPMLVEGLLPDRSLFLLTGKPKSGKSLLALDIADSVAEGRPALGELPVSRSGPVLYLAMEDGKREIVRRLGLRNRDVPQFGSMLLASSNLYFIPEPFNLSEPRCLARFIENARDMDPVLIVIDTAAEALDIRDWVSRSEIVRKIAPIRSLARDLCAVLLVAHNRKAEGDGGDEIAGSNALAGAADGWISVQRVARRENDDLRLFMCIEGRGGVGHELIAEMDHRSLRFRRVSQAQADAEESDRRTSTLAQQRSRRHAAARDTVRTLGGKFTITDLAAAMGLTYRQAWLLTKEMKAIGDVEEVEPGDRGGQEPPKASRPMAVFALCRHESDLLTDIPPKTPT
ncbi:MAG TPA: AAA family ATPase [Chthonomonadaceae bacterium]|nr:AAA family ATPase [Chthonomonadaceae bacterium]